MFRFVGYEKLYQVPGSTTYEKEKRLLVTAFGTASGTVDGDVCLMRYIGGDCSRRLSFLSLSAREVSRGRAGKPSMNKETPTYSRIAGTPATTAPHDAYLDTYRSRRLLVIHIMALYHTGTAIAPRSGATP